MVPRNSGSENAICECHVPDRPRTRGRELKWELNSDQSKKLRARSTTNKMLREQNFHPGPGHEVAHAKGENFLYQASRALQRPGQRSLCQVRRFACLRSTVLYCNPSNDTAARAQHPCLDFHSHFQTASMGLGPVKSRHLVVAEAEAGNLVTLGLEKWAAVCRAYRKF